MTPWDSKNEWTTNINHSFLHNFFDFVINCYKRSNFLMYIQQTETKINLFVMKHTAYVPVWELFLKILALSLQPVAQDCSIFSLVFLAVLGLLLLPLWFWWSLLPIMEAMADTRAAVKPGSDVMAAVAALMLSLISEAAWIRFWAESYGCSNPRELSSPKKFDW